MKIADIEELEYLHDATVKQITVMCENDSKQLRLAVTCDAECGHPGWSGKTVMVIFTNVLRAQGALFGHVAGQDILSSLSERVTPAMEQNVEELCAVGIAAPRRFLHLTLQSGSEIEIACDDVEVHVQDATQ